MLSHWAGDACPVSDISRKSTTQAQDALYSATNKGGSALKTIIGMVYNLTFLYHCDCLASFQMA